MKYRFVALCAATLLSAAALAGGDKPGAAHNPDAKFKSLDRNNDERLSQAEVTASSDLATQFTALDADSDGYVTKREYAAAFPKSDKPAKDY